MPKTHTQKMSARTSSVGFAENTQAYVLRMHKHPSLGKLPSDKGVTSTVQEKAKYVKRGVRHSWMKMQLKSLFKTRDTLINRCNILTISKPETECTCFWRKKYYTGFAVAGRVPSAVPLC
jgi:hypothetical protein